MKGRSKAAHISHWHYKHIFVNQVKHHIEYVNFLYPTNLSNIGG